MSELTVDIARSISVCVPRKTLDDMKGNPKHVTPEELAAVLRDHGWELRAGTLHGTIAVKGSRTFHFPRPHGKHLLPVYVRRAVKVIEEEE